MLCKDGARDFVVRIPPDGQVWLTRYSTTQSFAVNFFAHLIVQLERSAHAADAVVAQLQAVIYVKEQEWPETENGIRPLLIKYVKVSHIRPRLPASGESFGSGLVPLHWHLSHPACILTGPRITEVSLSEYRITELFHFQGSCRA